MEEMLVLLGVLVVQLCSVSSVAVQSCSRGLTGVQYDGEGMKRVGGCEEGKGEEMFDERE